MANAVQGSTIGLLKAHAERMALGVAVTLLAGYLVVHALFPGRGPALIPEPAAVDGTLAPPKAVDLTRRALDPYNTPMPVPKPDGWEGSYATAADIKIVKGPPVLKVVHAVAEVVELKAQATPATVTITFETRTAVGADVVEAVTATYVVERKEAGGEWKELAVPVNAVKREFRDAAVVATKVYAYRVSAVTEDPLAAAKRNTSKELEVRVPDVWSFELRQVTVDRFAEGKGWIDVIVKRYDMNSGRTHEARFMAYESTEAGERRIGFDREGKHERSFTQDRKPVTISFDCGYDLESVKAVDEKSRQVTLVRRTNPKDRIVLNDP